MQRPSPTAGAPADAGRHASRAVALLARARDAGHFNTLANRAWLASERDLDALREREDLRLLMMDLSFPADPFARAD
jgi:hypothetical protein